MSAAGRVDRITSYYIAIDLAALNLYDAAPSTWLGIFQIEISRLFARFDAGRCTHDDVLFVAFQNLLDRCKSMPGNRDVLWARLFVDKEAAKRARLRLAVAAATRAFERSGRMLDAALAYAAHGLPVFPLTVNKTPVPRRERDAAGKEIPGTGSFNKATTKPQQIHAWWDHHENLIGLPTGARSGVWCVDVDSPEDHDDGITEWNAIAAQHEPIVTREHRSATGGPHLIFNWHAEQPIHCGKGALPKKGIQVKGEGGYIVVPPSQRRERSYTVYSDIEQIDAPSWLLDLILQGQSRFDEPYSGGQVTAEFDEIADALSFIPNDEDWDGWTAMGLRIFAATNGEGYALFDQWSAKSSEYCIKETPLERWEDFQSSPPTRTGVEKIFKIARAYGWARKRAPTYPVENLLTPDAARSETRRIVCDFLADIGRPKGLFEVIPTAWAMRVDTGVGKTRITIEELAAWLRGDGAGKTVIYAVPTHKLGREIEELFASQGVRAKVFYGREAIDREVPGGQTKMCLDLFAVSMAMKCHADISKTCCRHNEKRCKFFDRCGYQRQQHGDPPAVWIVAHDMLFHHQRVFGEPAAVIIDEAFWTKGLRGTESDKRAVPIDSLTVDYKFVSNTVDHELNEKRGRLANALRQQDKDGGVERQHLAAALSFEDCTHAIALEWQRAPQIWQYPGMPEAEIKRLAKNAKQIDAIQHAQRVIKIWGAVRELLDHPKIAVSGRLILKQQNGQRVVEWRGVAPISKQFQVPTLMLDATLPDATILKIYHPQVEVVADIRVMMQASVCIRQTLHAPTSSTKLDDVKHVKHLAEIKRYILKRYIETNRQRTLVIAQEKVDEWLKGSGLPANITITHFNAIAGLDEFKDARLLILLGRTQPGPAAVETLAAALSGAQPEIIVPGSRGFAWYSPVERGIRLTNDQGVAVRCDQHPDQFAESIRWQICEGELMQALGRARGVNRTTDTPLDVDILSNVVLPITVNEVVIWKMPSLLVETAAEGVVLTSRVDLMKVWPLIWPNDPAARRTLEALKADPKLIARFQQFQPVTYQLVGPKMKPRYGWFDSTLIPDPSVWLKRHIGPLQHYVAEGPELEAWAAESL